MLSRPFWSCRVLRALIFLIAALSVQSTLARSSSLRQWPNGIPAPPLNLVDLNGKQWDIQNLHGKVVVLNFWASWCGPCVDELPFLNELAGSESTKGKLVILGVNFKESAATIQRFLDEHRLRYPILMDKTGAHFKQWTNGVIPTTVLIDQDGRPRWRVMGELEPADPAFRQAVEKLLDSPHQDVARPPAISVK